jgi:hypothetical protein
MTRYSNDANGSTLVFGKSRNASIDGNTVVTANDELGKIRFCGADGTDFGNTAAEISAFCDGTPGSNDMPGGLKFSTAADGGTGAAERMRIDSSGNIKFNSGYGSVETAFGVRAWVAFQGTSTAAIRASGNISSITDAGTGTFDFAFTNNLPDANYALGALARATTAGGTVIPRLSSSIAVNTIRIFCINNSDSSIDPETCTVIISR